MAILLLRERMSSAFSKAHKRLCVERASQSQCPVKASASTMKFTDAGVTGGCKGL